jgi:hypothetical protein
MLKNVSIGIIFFSLNISSFSQLKWNCVDSIFQPLPSSVHVYRTSDSLPDGKPNIAFYLIADLKDKHLVFDTDTTLKRRLTPDQFYQKNKQPLAVVNCTFFSFETNQNLNVVIRDGKMLGYNIHSIPGRGKDTLTYKHPLRSALGITQKRIADIAWIFSDSLHKYAYAIQVPAVPATDSGKQYPFKTAKSNTSILKHHMPKASFKKWKMHTAVGGGPVLLQGGEIKITNEEELMFTGNAINDKHPRTAMGYTKDGKLIILVVQGRYPGIAEGVTLKQEAEMLKNLGCIEALNLDGGGSSCLLVNGKNTITPSSAGIQRPVPAVFLINEK